MIYPALLGLALTPAVATATSVQAFPPSLQFNDSTRLSLTANLAWDVNRVDDAAAGMGDGDDWRRREIGLLLKRDGVYDVSVIYDDNSETLLDAAVRLETSALFGRDLGRIRIGQMKLATSIEGAAPNRHISLMEQSLATQTFYAVDRAGVTWTFERPDFLIDAGVYDGNFHGRNEGGTQMLRAAWTPTKAPGQLLHLGAAFQRDTPRGLRNAAGQQLEPAQRWSSRTGQSLSGGTRLLDTGSLSGVNHVDRQVLQGLWIDGTVSVQGEYFWQQTHRRDGLRDYSSDGFYIGASVLSPGLSRGYAQGITTNPRPQADGWGTEWLVRHARVDLDSDGIRGGSAKEWTAGANLYVGHHLKFQLNYTRTRGHHGATELAPETLQLRTQFMF